jgi:hypothetical protein
LAELLEHLLLVLRGYANARVADRDLYASILGRGLYFDLSTLRRELDRVGEQIEEDLSNLAFIRLNLAQSIRPSSAG